jgi:AcrR family transcriptional regulator
MARSYTLKRRAEQQADTRLRIVEAAVDLHRELGPAHTPLSRVAEQAGVTRNTLYAHFPDERSLLLACSALSLERDPLPDAAPWRAVRDREERLRTGLAAIYAWYERNAELAGCVLRDAQSHALTQEVAALRYGPHMHAYATVLGAGLGKAQRAMLGLAMSFPAWRSLVIDGGLKPADAARAMARAVVDAAT